jgi:hypothetical protein
MNGADLLVLALENEGVKQIFGVPGEENLAIVEALRRSRIKLVLTRHEQAAAFMAATVGRLSGHAGVCLSTLGPGALNLTTGAAFAKLACNRMRHFSTTAPASRYLRRSSDASIRHRSAGARGSAPGRSAPRCPLALARQRWANRRAGRIGQWSRGHPGGRPTAPLFFGYYICIRFLRILY